MAQLSPTGGQRQPDLFQNTVSQHETVALKCSPSLLVRRFDRKQNRTDELGLAVSAVTLAVKEQETEKQQNAAWTPEAAT